MLRFSLALPALALFCLLIPQTASATPTLEWDGRAEMMNGFVAPDVGVHGATGDKVAKNIGHGVKGGLYLGVGIPVSIVGGLLTGVAIYFFVSADLALAADVNAEGVALGFRIVGVIFLALGAAALGSGISLIIKGVTALTKISDRNLTGPDPRMARAEKNRARWGMQMVLGGVPLRR